jgi:hypothetical protein
MAVSILVMWRYYTACPENLPAPDELGIWETLIKANAEYGLQFAKIFYPKL